MRELASVKHANPSKESRFGVDFGEEIETRVCGRA